MKRSKKKEAARGKTVFPGRLKKIWGLKGHKKMKKKSVGTGRESGETSYKESQK